MEYPEFSIGQNAKLPVLVVEASGITSLVGATTLVFHFWKRETSAVVKTGVAALFTDGSDNRIKYDWAGSLDTAVFGDYLGYFTGLAQDGKPFRAPSGRDIAFLIKESR